MDFPSPISSLPMLVFFAVVGIIGVILLAWFLSRTKTPTTEARLGQFEIIMLPEGARVCGLVSLARSAVKQEYVQYLAQDGRITDTQAKNLNEVFDANYFYALRSGRHRVLLVSDKNIEDPKFSITTEQVFDFPFGFVTRRLVIADAVSTDRAGWRTYRIRPRNLQIEILGDEYKYEVALAGAAACLQEAAIRVKNEQPLKEILIARERQLGEAYTEVAKQSDKASKAVLALSTQPLLEVPDLVSPPPPSVTVKKMSWDRIVLPIIVFVVAQYIIPMVKPDILDPTMYSLGITAVLFIFYPWIKAKISKWFS